MTSLQRANILFLSIFFFLAAKMVAMFPFEDPVVSGLSLLGPHQRGDLPPTAITNLARRFPNLVPDFEQLEEEFLDYQTS